MTLVLAALLALAIILLVLQPVLIDRRHRATLNMERARQDQLLNRLAARNLTEYTAVEQAVSVATVPAPPREPVRHLYDPTGLIQIDGPADIEDDAYDRAGSL